MEMQKNQEHDYVGMIRQMDCLARFVIPKEFRDRLGLEAGSELEILVDNRQIRLRPFQLGQKSVGIVREFDRLGRFTIPKECRRHLRLEPDSELEISMEDDEILLRPYHSQLTEDLRDLEQYRDCLSLDEARQYAQRMRTSEHKTEG